MNIQQFKYVLAVDKFRHFETAAEKCYISQSTLSTMILKFEDEIGITIFDRKKRPMEITNEGKKIIERLKIITNEIADLEEICKEMKGEIKGKIKIGCIHTVTPYLLPLILPKISVKYPDLNIEVKELTTNNIIHLLKLRELDIGIVSTPIEETELLEYPIYEEPYLYFDASGEIPKLQKLTQDAINTENFWIMEEEHCMRDQVLHFCGRNSHDMNHMSNINFKAGSIDSLIRFTKANKGRTILPLLSALELKADDAQHIRLFKSPEPQRTIGLLTHQFFTKKRILELLQKEIEDTIKPYIDDQHRVVLH